MGSRLGSEEQSIKKNILSSVLSSSEKEQTGSKTISC